MKRLFTAAGALLALMLTGAELDKGGVTFDFKKISDERFKAAASPAPAGNLLTDPEGAASTDSKDPLRWRGDYCYLHTREISKDDPKREEVRKMVRWTVEGGVFKVVKPSGLKDILPDKVLKSTSGGWRKVVDLPDDKGGLYAVSFQYRSKLESAGRVCLIVTGSTERAGKRWKGNNAFFQLYPLLTSDSWQNYRGEILIPPGCRSLELVWRIDGTGELEFRNPAVTAEAGKTAEEKLTLRLSPMASLDRTFALAQDLPGTLAFIWKRNGAPAEAKLDAPVLVVVLPREIVFHESANLKLLGRKETPDGIEYRIDLTPRRKRPAVLGDFDFYLRHTMLISTSAEPGTTIAEGTAWVEDQGVRISNVERVRFIVIPAFKAAKPEHFSPGVYFGGRDYHYTGKNIDLCSKMYDAAGVRWIVGSQKDAYSSWRKAGVKYITPGLSLVANGFRVGPAKGRPEEDKYRYIGARRNAEMEQSVCPSAVYEKRPFYLNNTVPFLTKALEGADGLWGNWEPYKYAGRGCFCDTCRRKFAEYLGVPEEQIKPDWPQELAMGRKYYDQAVRFRSLEHAKLVLALNEAVTAATGGERSLGFIPGVSVQTMTAAWRENGYDKETHPIDYAGKLRWLDPWGPYAFWNPFVPYSYRKAFNLKTFLMAKEVRETAERDYGPNPPKLLAFPHGLQGRDWVTQPESITIELLSFMFNGWHAATVYYFPRGYDARYWRAFAEAADIAAQYEKYVFTGKRIDDRAVLTPLEPYAADTGHRRMLQHTAYELDGSVVVAAFNFWRDGQVFFRCQVKGLDPAARYAVMSRDARFVREDGSAFTGAELAEGITLQAGAVRCAVYKIVPEEQSAGRDLAVLTPSAVEKFRLDAQSDLLIAKAADEKYEDIYGVKESRLENISHAGIDCTAERKKQTLSFTSGENKAVMYAPSFTVTNWTVSGMTILNGKATSGAGAVSFWLPSCQNQDGFVVTGQKKIEGGLEITGEKRMLDTHNARLAGLLIRQTVRLTDNLKTIAVSTMIVNDSDHEIDFGVRYNLMPVPPAAEGGFTRLSIGGSYTDFKRNLSRHLFTTGIDDRFEPAMRKLFSVKPEEVRRIDPLPVFFSQPGLTVKLNLEPAGSFAGAGVWDDGRQAAGTFEPCFRHMTLTALGGSFTFSSVLSIEKQ